MAACCTTRGIPRHRSTGSAPALAVRNNEISDFSICNKRFDLSCRGNDLWEPAVRKSIAVRVSRSSQDIPDPSQASSTAFRGKPLIGATKCASGCNACVAACPTAAITLDPLVIDLGRCVLCGYCEPTCPSAKISFSNDVCMGVTDRHALTVSQPRPELDPIKVNEADLFAPTLHVSGCPPYPLTFLRGVPDVLGIASGVHHTHVSTSVDRLRWRCSRSCDFRASDAAILLSDILVIFGAMG
jgi:formate hydrogenlyase subunit 6/NADH:ubiquinone oxidoreductase subunit I